MKKHLRRDHTRFSPFRLSLLGLLLLAVLLSVGPSFAEGEVKIIFVDKDATNGANSGSSWADAYTSLAEALHAAEWYAWKTVEIWVAEGTYRPIDGMPNSSDRTISFELESGVALYGGFAGGETSREERNPVTHETILTGDIGTPDYNGDNSYHVVYSEGVDDTAILDGFTVTGGNADGSGGTDYEFGGGMCNKGSSPTLSNCTFRDNYATMHGGGMANHNASSPILSNCTFSGNRAGEGGGMYNDKSSPKISNCKFSENSADDGGGMYNFDSNPGVLNCTFSRNTATGTNGKGGGMYNTEHSSPKVSNCTFSVNQASYWGGGMFNEVSDPIISNCTFSGNKATGEYGYGGGMFNKGFGPTVSNCTFSGNSASYYGGGMYNSQSSPFVINCTFFRNTAIKDGGGMCSDQLTPKVINSIFWEDEGGEIVNFNGSTPTLAYCVVQGGYSGTGNLDDDPRLGELADNGGPTKTCALDKESSAIDRGVSSYQIGGVEVVLSADQRGVRRPCPLGGSFDIGAYEAVWYTVIVSADVGGTVSVEPYGVIVSPDLLTASRDFTAFATPAFVIMPEESMGLTGVRVDGASVDLGSLSVVSPDGYAYTFDPLSASHDLEVAFAVKTFTITGTVSGDVHGSVTAIPSSGDWGGSSTITVSADVHYHIVSVRDNGSSIDFGTASKDFGFTLVDVTEDHEVEAFFAIDTHSLTTATGGTGAGTVSPDHGTYDYGTEVTLTAIAAESSTFTGWTGVDSSNGTSATVTMTGDRSVTASFALKTFTINATAGSGGSVSPASATVTWGHDHTVTITADDGYAIDDVIVDGTDHRGPVASYTFTNVEGPHTLHAEFKLLDVSVTSADMHDDPDAAIMDALAAVADGGTIAFPDDLAGEIFVLSDDIQINQSVTLVAPDGGMALSGGGSHRVLYVEASGDVTLEGFTICSGDAGEENGGGILNEGSLTIRYCTLKDNEAYSGGGLFNAAGSGAMVTNCRFSGNIADGANSRGGGMANEQSGTIVTDCVFSGNRATNSGGGMANVNAGTVVTDSTFIGNYSMFGGGMGNEEGSPSVTNCTFSDNKANSYGGGMNNRSSTSPIVMNCTFTGNKVVSQYGSGGGMWSNYDCDLTVTNCIFWANENRQIVQFGNIPRSHLSHSVVQSEDLGSCIIPDVVITEDPHLLGLADNGCVLTCGAPGQESPLQTFALGTGSSALDAGLTLETVSTDQRGVSRPLGSSFDIGAYEAERFTVTVFADIGGTVSAEPYGLIASPDLLTASKDFTAFDTPTFVITPEESMDLIGVWLDTVPLSFDVTGTVVTLEPLSADHELEVTFAVRTFDVRGTVSGDVHGSVTATPASVDWGGSSTVTVSADAHYHIDWISVDGNSVDFGTDSRDYTVTFHNVSADHEVEAAFAIDTHSLTTATGGTGTGTVSPDHGTYDWDTPVTLTATPADSSNFTGWSGDLSGSTNPATFTMTGDKSVTASFALKTFTITATAGGGGSISPASATVTWGHDHTVNIVADDGYVIDDVIVDGTDHRGPVTGYTFTNVQGAHTLHAEFKPLDVSVTSADMRDDPDAAIADALADVADGGTITFPDDIAGETFDLSEALWIDQSVTFVAPDGGMGLSGGGSHRVLHVEVSGDVTLEGFTICSGDAGSENGGGILNEGTLALTNCTVAGNEAVSGGGIWNGTTGTLNLSCSTVSANSSGIGNGGTLSVKSSIVAANEGADIEDGGTFVSSGFNLLGTGSTHLLPAPGDTVSVDITFSDLFVGSLGSFGSGVPVLALKTGAPALDGGCSTDIDGNLVSEDQRGTARPQGSGYDIGAYEAEWFTVTVSADIGGTVSADPYGIIVDSANFTAFDTPTFVITPEESMDLVGVRVDGASVDLSSLDVLSPDGYAYTFDPLGASHDLEVSFAVRIFSVTGTVSGDHGSVSATPASVDWGGSSDVTVNADDHYHIVSVTDNGSPVSFGTASKDFGFTLVDVTEDHDVEASFAIDTHSLTTATGGTGAGTVSPDHGTYDYGTEVTLTAIPAASSNFTGWSGDLSGMTNPATVTMTGDKSVTASFALKSFTITATAGGGGSVSPTSATVTWGQDHAVNIIPYHGYTVSDVVVDGVSVGVRTSYSFGHVQDNHTLHATFVPDQETLEQGGIEGLDFGEGGNAFEMLSGGTASVDLPAGITGGSFSKVASTDLGGFWIEAVRSGDVGMQIASIEPGGTFLCGVSFDVEASGDTGVGLLPVDLELVVSEDLLSTGCLEAIATDEPEVGLAEAFLGHVSVLKMVSGDLYDLYDVALDSGTDPVGFFALSRDEAGNFLVGLRLLVADTSPEGVAAVQAVPASDDCRFLIFDGSADGHYRDPIIAVERGIGGSDGSGGGGCSVLTVPGLGLLLLPLLRLLKK